MTDENESILKLLKVRVHNVRCRGNQLYKSNSLMLDIVSKMREKFSNIESLLEINEINFKKNHKYTKVKEEALKAITLYRSEVNAMMEEEEKKMYQEEERYKAKIRGLGTKAFQQ